MSHNDRQSAIGVNLLRCCGERIAPRDQTENYTGTLQFGAGIRPYFDVHHPCSSISHAPIITRMCMCGMGASMLLNLLDWCDQVPSISRSFQVPTKILGNDTKLPQPQGFILWGIGMSRRWLVVGERDWRGRVPRVVSGLQSEIFWKGYAVSEAHRHDAVRRIV
jgi:hypothetical protein